MDVEQLQIDDGEAELRRRGLGGMLARGARRVPQTSMVYVRYAGFVSRVMAMVIDLLLLAATLAAIGIANDFILRTSGIGQLMRLIAQGSNLLSSLVGFLSSPAFELLLALGLSFAYFATLHSLGGATIGKYVMGLRVLAADGGRLSTAQAALRTFAYALSALGLYLGFLAVLVNDRRRGWHDRIAGTVVVHSWQPD
jgi:uncharacterized RDD family membrane protein YckC